MSSQYFRVHHYEPNEDGGYPLGALIGYLPICRSQVDNHNFIYHRLISSKLIPENWFGVEELVFDSSRFEPVGSIFVYRRTPRLNLLFLFAIQDYQQVQMEPYGGLGDVPYAYAKASKELLSKMKLKDIEAKAKKLSSKKDKQQFFTEQPEINWKGFVPDPLYAEQKPQAERSHKELQEIIQKSIKIINDRQLSNPFKKPQ